MIVFLGGKNSIFINELANHLSNEKNEKVFIISSSELLNKIKLNLKFLTSKTKFIIAFCNKSSKLDSVKKSKKILQNTVSMLKDNNIKGGQIYLFGSESHLAHYFEYCEPEVKKALLRDQYAFDCLLKRNILKSNFEDLVVINVPGIKRKRSILNKILRFIFLYVIAKCHSLKYVSNIKNVTIEDLAEKLVSNNLDQIKYETKNLERKLKISRSWILNYIPVKMLKFNVSIIKHNIDKNIISISAKNKNFKN
mgnify:CR=1 FL=1